MTPVLAIDVGGANLKIADGAGFGRSEPLALWKEPEQLPSRLRALIEAAPLAARLAATMTGEIADCFRSKAEGVRAIVSALEQAAAELPLSIYMTDGTFASPEQAVDDPLLAAASNWHALAFYACRFLPEGGDGLLIDIGSTTTDLIPLVEGKPAAKGRNDFQRLISGELVYTGVVRSPVCALVDSLSWSEQCSGVAQELFATTRDVYLIKGDLPEDASDCQTADGRPATVPFALERLARMVCADECQLASDSIAIAANQVATAQLELISQALARVLRAAEIEPAGVVISGQGEFLARRVCQQLGLKVPLVSLAERLGQRLSTVAPAHALAVLARERADG